MKKSIICLLVAGVLTLGLTACGEDEHRHSFNKEDADPANLATAADCTHAATYYYTCECGEKGTETFSYGAVNGHTFEKKVQEAKYLKSKADCTHSAVYYYACNDCNEVGTKTYEYGDPDPDGHIYSESLTYTDGTGHYYPAICEHTTEKKGEEGHTLVTSQDGTEESCKCGYTVSLVTSLATPENLSYDDDEGEISWDSVQYAKKYEVTVTDGEGSEALKEEVTETSINVASLDAGKYTVSVKAVFNSIESEAATLPVNVLLYDGDVILEAENSLLNLSHYSNDTIAHGKAYALGFDDCGQGMYYRYYAYEAGERTVDVAYSTGSPNSYMNMYVNGGTAVKVTFAENTGWFGDSKTTATATVTITVKAGWNEIYLIKDGNGEDDPSYGGWGQVDYIKIYGTGKKFDVSELDRTSTIYKLEAECAQWHWADANIRPAKWGSNFSMGYGLGSMDADGDGVKFTFRVAESGTYKIQLAYGADGARTLNVSVDGGDDELTNFSNSTTGWDNVQLDGGFNKELTAGEHSIDFKRAGGWLTIDYVLITKVA